MGLLNTEVEITLVGKNISYYENKGYVIPRVKKSNKMCVPRNTKITVQIKDVSYGSNVKVDVICDCCGKQYNESYYSYYKHNYAGKCYCLACANKLFNSGENHAKWRDDMTDEEREIGRCYPEYTQFVKRVFKRDNYTCQCCGLKPKRGLVAHHLNGYNWCIEGRTDDKNAVTLCNNCHSNFHFIYGCGDNTKEQYEEWIGHALENLEKYDRKLPTARKIYCYEEDKIYDSAIQYSKTHNTDDTTVYNVCNRECKKRKTKNGTTRYMNLLTIKGNHLFWLDEYEKMTKNEILEIINRQNKKFRKVICLTTNQIFNNISLATKKFNLYGSGIVDCCIGKQKTAGKLQDGTPLCWMYYEEYLEKMHNGEYITKIKISGSHKNVVCLTTGMIFNKIKIGADYYNADPSRITACCRGRAKYAGKLSDGTRLAWMYYDNFLDLPQEERNNVLSKKQESLNDDSFIM